MSSGKPSRICNIAFGLWLVGGVVCVIASGYWWDEWLYRYMAESTFQYVGPQPMPPELQAKREAMDYHWAQCVFGPIIYGAFGIWLFHRRGWSVVGIAGVIVLLSWFAQCGVGMGHL